MLCELTIIMLGKNNNTTLMFCQLPFFQVYILSAPIAKKSLFSPCVTLLKYISLITSCQPSII